MPEETDAPVLTLVDNVAQRRFEIQSDGQLAGFTRYHLEGDATYALTHTETEPAFAGRGIGSSLIADVLAHLRANGANVLPYCPFVNGYLRKHPDQVDLVPEAERRRFGLAP